MDFSKYVTGNTFSTLECSSIIDIKELVSFLQSNEHITELFLSNCSIDNEGAEELTKSPNLTLLDLSFNSISDEGVKALAKSPNLKNIKELYLQNNIISDEGIKALAKSPNLKNIKELYLQGNIINNKGIKALAESPYLKNLKKLSLEMYEMYLIDIEGAEALARLKYSYGCEKTKELKLWSTMDTLNNGDPLNVCKIFHDFLMEEYSKNQSFDNLDKDSVKKMIFDLALRDLHGDSLKYILKQLDKYPFLINLQDEEGHTLSHFYNHSHKMQEFLFQHGLIPEKEPELELEGDAELQGILRDRQSVHTKVANKETCFFTAKLVESINASGDELKQAATSYMENVPELLGRYQNDSVRIKLLSLTQTEKESAMKETLPKGQDVPNDKEFIKTIIEEAKEVLERKYLRKDENDEYVEQISTAQLQYDYMRDNAKVTIPKCISYVKLLIDKISIPLEERKELLVTLANQNPELVQEKLPEIRSELENNTISKKQIANRATFYQLLDNVNGSKIDKLFKEISGLGIEGIWREQKEFILLKQIYVAATTYGKRRSACTHGTWSQIINSVNEIDSELMKQYDQNLEEERKLEKQQNSITEENITSFVENLAGKLIQYVKDDQELEGALVDFAVAIVDIENPEEITLKYQKILAKINQEFTASIQEFLPNYGRSIPKESEYKIIINKLPEIGAMQNFVQVVNMNNGQVTEQPDETLSLKTEPKDNEKKDICPLREEGNGHPQPLTQISITSLDDIRNPIQEKNDEQQTGVQSVYNGLSGSTQTKSTSSKAYAIGIGCGMIIGAAIAYLLGAAALAPTIAAIVFFAAIAVGALVGYGVGKFCEKVSGQCSDASISEHDSKQQLV